MKSNIVIAPLLFLLLMKCMLSCALPPKVNYIEEENWYDKMTEEDVQRYNLHSAVFNRIVFVDYANAMSLLDSTGAVTRASVKKFSDLFMPQATVLNDIHPDPHPLSPSDYGAYVKHYMYKGVDAELAIYGNFDRGNIDKRFHRYYQVGSGEHEYYMHRAVEKRIRYGLNDELQVVGWGEKGKSLLLDFTVYINDDTNTAKIADIKPILN